MKLENKTAIVTGASGGIGHATAKKLLQEGEKSMDFLQEGGKKLLQE